MTVRYETPDFQGETRRERNIRFGQPAPEIKPVENGEYILECFWQIARFRDLTENGPQPLKPIDIFNWEQLTGDTLNRSERKIILALDQAYLAALMKEREINHKRMQEKSKRT